MIFRFGPFRLDIARRLLLEGEDIVVLRPKAYILLKVLVQRYPEAVRKDELIEIVWNDVDKATVCNSSLTNTISEIRRALRDDSANPTYVRTAHRHGYAFCVQPRMIETAAKPARFWLVRDGDRFPLAQGETTLGRDPNSDVWLDFDKVSWNHARVVVDAGKAVIEDLASTNGTFVEKRKLHKGRPEELLHGHEVRVANVVMHVWSSAKTKKDKTNAIAR